MTNSDDEKNIDKKPKTLSLNTGEEGSTPDISKILEEKTKSHKGRTKVEIRGKKPLVDEKKEVKDASKVVKSEDKNKLTEEEQALRTKLAQEEVEFNTDAPSGLSGIQVVSKEEDKEEVSVNADSTHVIKSSFEVKESIEGDKVSSKKDSVKNKNFDEEEKKEKKKLAEQEQRRANNNKNWKNSYSIEEEDEDEEEEEIEEVAIQQKKVHQIKRKNKRRDISKEKIVREIQVRGAISVRELSNRMSEKFQAVVRFLSKFIADVNIDTVIDLETIELVISEFGHKFILVDESSIEAQYLDFNDRVEDLKERPPVVVVMGHVDHGKTTLLDTIRKANIAEKEAGGITQHIGAYQVHSANGKSLTFLDTPGHEAFTQIRARGSKITDVVVLVVAADDGIKPQTIEAISHAKAANAPIVVAINKIDKPEKNIDRIKAELLKYDVVVEAMGGDVLSVEISAKGNIGIDKLLESILLQAEMLDLKTNYKALGQASVIEVKQEKGFGFLASVIVERGILRIGDIFVCGNQVGKIKVMVNDKGERIKESLPSMPVEISGFAGSVSAGDKLIVVQNESKANELINYRNSREIKEEKKDNNQAIIDLFSNDMVEVKSLPVIIKTDMQGSLEAILGSIGKIEHKDIEVKIVHSGVGEITESDVMLCKATGAIMIGFNSRANAKAKDVARRENIDIRYHSIIYNLIDDIKMILTGLLDPDIIENIIGYAEVREVFNVTKVGKVAGCYVKEGILKRSSFVRLLRNNIVVHDGVLSQLKRFKDDAKEVKQEFECGVSFDGYNDIKIGDIIECYEKTEVRNNVE